MAPASLEQWLRERPFTLALSAGFFGFFAHAGLVAALEERELWPARITGASAGSLIGGMWASGMDAGALRHRLLSLRRRDFWDPWPGLGLLRGRRLRHLLERWLGALTFESCRLPLAVSTYDVLARRLRVLERGPLAPAMCASCAVPFLFHPVWIQGRPYLDGGVVDRPALAAVTRADRVLHHHLPSRSPRRHATGQEGRAALVGLSVPDLPRLGPGRLQRGAEAFERARAFARAALSRPVRARALSRS